MRRNLKHTLTALAVTAAAFATLAPAHAVPVSALVVSGDAAPDSDGTFDSFNDISMNGASQLSFQGVMAGTANDRGIFFINGSGAAVQQIARSGQALPPGGSGTFRNVSSPSLNEAGEVAFLDTGIVGATPGRGLFVGNPGSLTKILQYGDADPDGGGRTNTFISLADPYINDDGDVAHPVSFVDGLIDVDPEGLSVIRYNAGAGTIDVLARPGDSAAGNGTFNNFDLRPKGLNNSDQVLFDTSGILGATPSDAERGLYLTDGAGVVTEVVREEDAVPSGGGATFDTFPDGGSHLNNNGAIAFSAKLDNSGSTEAGVFLTDDAGATLTTIARTGTASPDANGTVDNVILLDFKDNDAMLMSVVFEGTADPATGGGPFDSGDTRGLLYYDGSTLSLPIRSGMASADGVGVISTIANQAFNDAGQIGFVSIDRDTPGVIGGTFDDVFALQFYDPTLGLFPIARQGDAFLGSTFSNFEPVGVNDNHFAFTFNLADGRRGIGVWDTDNATITPTGAIPEPATAGLLGLAAMGLLARRRRAA